MAPGDVEVIVLQVVPETESQPEVAKNKLPSKVKSLKQLLENAPIVPPDFDPDEAKWQYLKEKHNL